MGFLLFVVEFMFISNRVIFGRGKSIKCIEFGRIGCIWKYRKGSNGNRENGK